MTTRASAPRCASCGMPLAPDAGSCAVCGARVPLIARPSGDEPPAVATPVLAPVEPTVAPPTGPLPVVPEAPRRADAGARAGREVRDAARPSYAPVVAPQDVPPIGPRVLAHAFDLLLALAVAGVGLVVDRVLGTGTLVAGVLGLALAVVQVLGEGRSGQTVGARLTNLRTVDDGTLGAPGVPRALLRQLVLGAGALVCLVGNWFVAASGAWDKGPRRRGWHDRASGTTVLSAAAGAEPAAVPAAWTPPPPGPATSTSSGTDALFAPPPVAAPRPAPVPRPVPVEPPGPAAAEGSGSPDLPAAVDLPPAPSTPDLAPPPGVGSVPPSTPAPQADLLPPPPVPGVGSQPAAPLPPQASVPPPVLDDADLAELEHTRVRDPESLRRRTGTLALHFDTGERVRVVGRGLVGRGPRAEDGEDILHVVALQDAARSLSRVHAEFGPASDSSPDTALWVVDRNSTNGTVVVDPAGAARVLPPGTRAVVRAGWSLRLGDREARIEDD